MAVMRGLWDSKISPEPIVTSHFKTLIDNRTGAQRVQDLAEQVGVPGSLGVVAGLTQIRFTSVTAGAILTVTGVFAAFLFQLSIQLLDRASSWLDARPKPSPSTSRHALLLGELSSNAAYAALVAAATTGLTLALTISSFGWQTRLATAATVAALAHLAMTMLLVLRRVFLLTRARLTDIRTGSSLGADQP